MWIARRAKSSRARSTSAALPIRRRSGISKHRHRKERPS
jgi:hypothetical protein